MDKELMETGPALKQIEYSVTLRGKVRAWVPIDVSDDEIARRMQRDAEDHLYIACAHGRDVEAEIKVKL